MPTEVKKVRPMAAAGGFYPAGASELQRVVDGLLAEEKGIDGQIRAVVAPHAGYAYSGQVAGDVFARLKGKNYKTVWLLGPSHYVAFSGVALPDYTHYQTPLGEVKVSSLTGDLAQEKNFQKLDSAHRPEHALEVELPFLQTVLADFEIVPMIFGAETSLNQLKEISQVLKKYYNDEILIVVSCDFTHYGPNYGYVPFSDEIQKKIKVMDDQVVEYLLGYQTASLADYLKKIAVTNDGAQVLTFLSEFFNNTAVKGQLIAYDTSGNLTGDVNSVSYVGLVFTEAMEQQRALNQAEKDYLLTLARQTLNHYFETEELLKVNQAEVPERLTAAQGVFVTLEKNNQLRGCIGYIMPVKSIYQAVIDNAIAAAVHDGRFSPVTQGELNDIDIEISVLSVPESLNASAVNRLSSLRPLIDGVVLRDGVRSSTYLPQVWEDLNNPQEFLSSLCNKGGWPNNCWQEDKVELYTYQADVFSESS